jgi:hypothetical protein
MEQAKPKSLVKAIEIAGLGETEDDELEVE